MSSNTDAQQRIALGMNAWERESYDEALAIFDDVLREHPTFPDVHNRRGLCLAILGNLQEALVAFDRAVELAPTYAEAHLNRGIVLKDLGMADEAQDAFDHARQLENRHGGTYPFQVGNQIAVTHAKLGDLYLSADKVALAVEQYRAALQVRPRFLDIRTRLAESLLKNGELEEAREELEFVLEKNPDFTSARLRLGVVMHRLGNVDEARRHWLHCADEDPGDYRARAYLNSLEESGDGGGDGRA